MDLNWRATSFFEGDAYTASPRKWNQMIVKLKESYKWSYNDKKLNYENFCI